MDTKSSVDIINTQLDFDLVLEDFNHPKPERIQLLCKAFIIYVFEIPESVISHLPLEALADTDEPESMQRSAPLIMVYTAMSQFIQDMSIDYNFTMDDLISPTSQKFRRLASFLADYLKFHAAMMPHWVNTCAIYEDKRHQLEELNHAVEEAEKRRDAIVADIECRKRRENELMTILGKKQTEFQSRFSAAKELESTIERNKEVIEEEKFKQTELSYEKDSLQMQLDQLALQIMPEHIDSEREQLKDAVARLRLDCEAQRKKCEETRNLINLAPHVGSMIEKASGFTEQLVAKKNLLDQKIMEKTDLEQRGRDAERKRSDIVEQRNAAEADCQAMDKNYQRDRQMHQERMEELAKRREELEQSIIDLKKANECDPVAERKLRAGIAAVRSLRGETIRNYNISAERSVKSYRALMNKLEVEKALFYDEYAYYEEIMKDLQMHNNDTTNTDFNDTANQTLPSNY